MIYTIKNQHLTVQVSDLGAELQSIQDQTGQEYLWQGDPDFWSGRSPVLFPYVGRLQDNQYTYQGTTYEMQKHGYARKLPFQLIEHRGDKLVFSLKSNAEMEKELPFACRLRLSYTLQGQTLAVGYHVENQAGKTMYFGIGAHPAFQVPFAADTVFEDYRLTFGSPCKPMRIDVAASALLSGEVSSYPLENDIDLPLTHDLFDMDAVILQDMDRTVTLHAPHVKKCITVSYPDMPYVGIWHTPNKPAPYVCIEPWVSLPSRDGVIEDLEAKPDLVTLPAGKIYHNTWTITIGDC